MRDLLIDFALWLLRAYEYEFPVEVREVPVVTEKLVRVPQTTERIIERPTIIEHTKHTKEVIHPEPRIVEREVEKIVEVDRLVPTTEPWKLPEDLKKRARELIEDAERDWPRQSGEYRRHQVYARLLKEFSHYRKPRIGLAIEVVCSTRGKSV
jgi:hypothetical protein